jgi:hypothetical protein
MRHIQIFEGFIQGVRAWHTSEGVLTSFSDEPAWFWTDPLLMGLRSDGLVDPDDHTYEVRVRGKILSRKEMFRLAKKLGIDPWDLEADLASMPSAEEKREMIQPFLDHCDGFFMRDYDPRDTQEDAESLLVFDPSTNADIIQEIPMTNM